MFKTFVSLLSGHALYMSYGFVCLVCLSDLISPSS